MIALESGAEDFREEEEGFEIITKPEDFESVQQALAENEIPVADSEITMVLKTLYGCLEKKQLRT